jgi:hypothetical protein
VRGVAIGRRNYLFAGAESGGARLHDLLLDRDRRCRWSSLHRLTAYVCNRTDQGMKFVHGDKGKFRSMVVPFPLEG